MLQAAPGSPRTIDKEEKGPCFVNHPAKNNNLQLGKYPRPPSGMRFTLMGLYLPAADKSDFTLNIPKCVGTN